MAAICTSRSIVQNGPIAAGGTCIDDAFCSLFSMAVVAIPRSHCQRCVDVWVRREDQRANYAKSPTSRSYPKRQSLEQGADHRSETTPASKTGLGHPYAARNCGPSSRPCAVEPKLRRFTLRRVTDPPFNCCLVIRKSIALCVAWVSNWKMR